MTASDHWRGEPGSRGRPPLRVGRPPAAPSRQPGCGGTSLPRSAAADGALRSARPGAVLAPCRQLAAHAFGKRAHPTKQIPAAAVRGRASTRRGLVLAAGPGVGLLWHGARLPCAAAPDNAAGPQKAARAAASAATRAVASDFAIARSVLPEDAPLAREDGGGGGRGHLPADAPRSSVQRRPRPPDERRAPTVRRGSVVLSVTEPRDPALNAEHVARVHRGDAQGERLVFGHPSHGAGTEPARRGLDGEQDRRGQRSGDSSRLRAREGRPQGRGRGHRSAAGRRGRSGRDPPVCTAWTLRSCQSPPHVGGPRIPRAGRYASSARPLGCRRRRLSHAVGAPPPRRQRRPILRFGNSGSVAMRRAAFGPARRRLRCDAAQPPMPAHGGGQRGFRANGATSPKRACCSPATKITRSLVKAAASRAKYSWDVPFRALSPAHGPFR